MKTIAKVVTKITALDQFYEVNQSGCWVWKKCIDRKGYGLIYRDGRSRRAPRYMWELINGPISDGLVVRHKCDVPACVNPNHLELGSFADNTADMLARGRAACGEKQGCSRLTDEAVQNIRASYHRGSKEFGQQALAGKYGVHQATVWRVLNGKTWNHLVMQVA